EQNQSDKHQDKPDEQLSQPDKPQRKSGRSRRRLLTLVILLVILVIVASVFFNLPQRIGLVETPTEKLLSATPDREAAVAMMADLQATGADTRGMEIYIFPVKSTEDTPSNENVAVAILDASQGFDFRNFSEADLMDYLNSLSSVGESGDYNIKRVAISYQYENGEPLMTLTAPTEIILKFANGTISREQFLEEMEGEVNFVEVAKKIAEIAQ
ncbi:hypothetical protein ACFLXO_06165, partial [Chloroflexota bacterium]